MTRLLGGTLVTFALIVPTMANAMSGAEFLQTNRNFSSGFAWGVMTSLTTFAAPVDPYYSTVLKRGECLRNTRIDSDTFYDAVESYIRREPSRLTEAASRSVLGVIMEMCDEM